MKITLSVKSKDSNDILSEFIAKIKQGGTYIIDDTGIKVGNPLSLGYIKGLKFDDKEGWDLFLKENKNEILSAMKSNGVKGFTILTAGPRDYCVKALGSFMYKNGYKYCVQRFYSPSRLVGYLNKEDAMRALEMHRKRIEEINPNNVDRLMRGIKTKNL